MKLENITLTVPGNLITTEERIIKHCVLRVAPAAFALDEKQAKKMWEVCMINCEFMFSLMLGVIVCLISGE